MPFSAKHAAALLLVAAPLAFAQAPNATSLDNSTSSENITDFSLDQYGIYLNASNFNATGYNNGYNDGYDQALSDLYNSTDLNSTSYDNSTSGLNSTDLTTTVNITDPTGNSSDYSFGGMLANFTNFTDPSSWYEAGYQDGYADAITDTYASDPLDYLPDDDQLDQLADLTFNQTLNATGTTIDALVNSTNTTTFDNALASNLAEAVNNANLTLGANNAGDVCGGYCTGLNTNECSGKGLLPNGSIEINGTAITKRQENGTASLYDNSTILYDNSSAPATFSCVCGAIWGDDTTPYFTGYCTYQLDVPCPCNTSYVSLACCNAPDGIVHEAPNLKLGSLDPNGTAAGSPSTTAGIMQYGTNMPVYSNTAATS